jgi:hypothetical protein
VAGEPLGLAALGVTSTGHIPGDRSDALAAEEEVWQAKAPIVGRVWLAVRLLEEGVGLPDEDHTDRVRYAQGILEELRALAAPAPPP